ncbi:hypothetical protein CY34DRAFT_7764 [Suillus luteus UH-Slu-Lm8-n1]|uniref:Dienelactone hydrolase domain-containing protein n=1 Tax=Suillus luteus UH-Slu-Lm8-n1 TaxID=930992 RepID=A0A0D0AFY8_9AGAM|nr:hypothetical protein CY34DRAFT_7764 [Suillus luteus UH-Slu-Lm8-n1]
MSFCEDCIKGIRTLETIDGVACYVATPTVEYAKDKVILFLLDAFVSRSSMLTPRLIKGVYTPQQLLADDFAKNGFKVVAMDYFNGDGLPADRILNDKIFNFRGWFATHGTEVTRRPPFDKVIAALKEGDVTKFGASGYCFGAPLLISSCENDTLFPAGAQAKADEILGDGKFAPGYRGEYFLGCTYGFAVRVDLSDPLVKAGKEGSFLASVEFFLEHI